MQLHDTGRRSRGQPPKTRVRPASPSPRCVGTLIAVAPTIGSARTVAQVRELALAIGYDVDAGLEEPADQGTVERTRNHEARS